MKRLMRPLAALLLLLLPVSAGAAPQKFQTHYVSQRGALAYLRQGPGYQYKVLWVYRHRGYPFQVTASFDVWRRVKAADGAVGWMSATMLSDLRTVLVTGKGRASIRETPDLHAKVIGLADPGAIAGLKACAALTCRIYQEGIDGWIPKERIWGVESDETFK